MKRFFKNAFFYILIAFISFALVASQAITRHMVMANIQNTANCLIAPSVDDRNLIINCTNLPQRVISPTPNLPPIPNPNLTDKERFLAAITGHLPTIPAPNTFEYILLRAYGAVFINQKPEIKLPPKVVFNNEQETKQFQSTLTLSKVNGTSNCYLQKSAADALNIAMQVQIPLKSGYGASDCTRSFATNLRFWQKYANRNTLEQVQLGKETKILGVVAPPGTSQHLWGLAVDLRVSNEVQKQALNKNGWYRTVEYDTLHWTYVGLPPERLTQFGFQNKVVGGINYWITPL
ncbi:D-alanyl-D-alanine carboxypeptidase family protein [Mastigocladopsis repens]|uniref:D-alanyl-D-alanine carboxypeptidase family protein n=1 Tax=Mastigocladopsis repens TaxID=221287 RepID=UPI0003117BF8|nr:D-alanyl-D-alanine carboxypeptidase family protein [Mastigocladopsis repens]